MKQLMTMILLLSSFGVKAEPFSEPMQFYEGWNGGNANAAYWIAAIGTIEADTAEKFTAFIKEKQPNGNKIVFHSPGGDLIGGMQLGNEIKKLGLNAFVANSINNPDNLEASGGKTANDFAPGKCLGACAYAFLGGKQRVLDVSDFGGFYRGMQGSQLGFQPLYATKEAAKTEEGALKAGKIINYILGMGVNPELLARLAQDKASIELTTNELARLNITNTQAFTAWTVEPYKQGFVIAAKNKNANSNQVEQITALCKSDPKKPELLLTSAPVDFDNDAFIAAEQAVFLTNGEQEYTVGKDKVHIRNTEKNAYFTIVLEEATFKQLVSGNHFYVQLRLPTAAGNFWAKVNITRKDKQFFKLLLTNCIE